MLNDTEIENFDVVEHQMCAREHYLFRINGVRGNAFSTHSDTTPNDTAHVFFLDKAKHGCDMVAFVKKGMASDWGQKLTPARVANGYGFHV